MTCEFFSKNLRPASPPLNISAVQDKDNKVDDLRKIFLEKHPFPPLVIFWVVQGKRVKIDDFWKNFLKNLRYHFPRKF